MEYKVQTNKGEMGMGYVDSPINHVKIGDMILPIKDFLTLMNKSILAKKQEIALNGYKMPSKNLGYQVDKLIFEATEKDTLEYKDL